MYENVRWLHRSTEEELSDATLEGLRMTGKLHRQIFSHLSGGNDGISVEA